MSVMILDAGNSIIKAKIARQDNCEIAFPHAMKQLTERDGREDLEAGVSEDLFVYDTEN